MQNQKLMGLLLSSFLIQSCSVLDEGSIAPGYVEAFNAVKNILIKEENKDITPELIERIPYASAKLSIGNGTEGLVILESKRGEYETWISADSVFLILKKGRIIQTAGLANNLDDIYSDYDVVDYLKHELLEFSSYYNFRNPELKNLKVQVSVARIGITEVKLFNGYQELLMYEETIKNKSLGWKAINQYFYNEEGILIKSKQSISPKLPPFYLEITKKPAI